MSYNKDIAVQILAALQAANFPANALPFAFAQAAHESTGFTDPAGADNTSNNFSGLTYGGSASQRATGAVPTNTQPDGNSHYAAYPGGIGDWAKDFYRFLCFNHGAGRPIDATNMTDYIGRLKTNGYFGDSIENYTRGMNDYTAILTPDFANVFHKEQLTKTLPPLPPELV